MKSKIWVLLFSSFLIMACSKKKSVPAISDSNNYVLEVPDTIILKSVVSYDHNTSLWTLNGVPYSGRIASYYADGSFKEKFGILNGLKQNEAFKWFPNGNLKNVSNYYKGKLHGKKKIWSSDSAHVLIAQFNYHKGRADGEQKKWYTTGEIYQILHLKSGREEGLQQAYRKNGDLYANYEAREGRIFGLKKTALCYGLEDESVKTKY